MADGAPRSAALSALRVRNFRLLFFARAISFFGSNLVPIAVAFAVLDMTGSATDVGIAFAARTVAHQFGRWTRCHCLPPVHRLGRARLMRDT